MSKDIKSGKEIIEEFKENLRNLEIDEKIKKVLIKLIEEDKISKNNIWNALKELREEHTNED